jgi:serine/threonine protein kinase
MANEHLISLQPGTVISGRYEVVKCLGAGSMGLVYACRHRELTGHLVAVKVLFPEVANDKIAASRFQNEIKASYGVSHPNVVRAYEYVRDGDLVAYSMEYVGGGDLADKLSRKDEPIPIKEVVKLLSQMCAGVQAIHDAGIIHRDLKPENILLTKEGNIKIADFGIAKTNNGPKLTEHGGVVGTLDYVSPEYMINSQVDWRSDIYAIGILGYEMTIGESPFQGNSVYDTMTKRLKYDPVNPSSIREECPHELDEIILKALARNPEERYQSAAEMFFDLRSISPETVKTPVYLSGVYKPHEHNKSAEKSQLEAPHYFKDSKTGDNERAYLGQGEKKLNIHQETTISNKREFPSLPSSLLQENLSGQFKFTGLSLKESIKPLGGFNVQKSSSNSQGFSGHAQESSSYHDDQSRNRESEYRIQPEKYNHGGMYDLHEYMQSSIPVDETTVINNFQPIQRENSFSASTSNERISHMLQKELMLPSEDWVRTSPYIPEGSSAKERAQNDTLKKISTIYESKKNNVIYETVTLCAAIFFGVGVGFVILKVYFPDIFYDKGGEAKVLEKTIEEVKEESKKARAFFRSG